MVNTMGIVFEVILSVIGSVIVGAVVTSANFTAGSINAIIAPYLSTFLLLGCLALIAYVNFR